MSLKNMKQALSQYQSIDNVSFNYVVNFVQKIKDGPYGYIEEDDVDRQLSNNFTILIEISMKQLAIYLLKNNDLLR